MNGNQVEETAIAPLGVASPQSVGGVSENEVDLPVAINCTTLTLVDAVPSQSAPLLAENQDCGVEPKDCHEGAYSAASAPQNEFCLNSAITNQTQTQEELEQSNPTSLLIENSVSSGEVKAVHKGESSVAPVLSAEKWSHEAIVANSFLIFNF